jgi:hypothetical protein
MGLTAKFVPVNDLLAFLVLEMEKASAGAGAFSISPLIVQD